MDTVYGILVLLLLIGFIAMWVWAWSSKRKKDFSEAAMLPLADSVPPEASEKDNSGVSENE